MNSKPTSKTFAQSFFVECMLHAHTKSSVYSSVVEAVKKCRYVERDRVRGMGHGGCCPR